MVANAIVTANQPMSRRQYSRNRCAQYACQCLILHLSRTTVRIKAPVIYYNGQTDTSLPRKQPYIPDINLHALNLGSKATRTSVIFCIFMMLNFLGFPSPKQEMCRVSWGKRLLHERIDPRSPRATSPTRFKPCSGVAWVVAC